MRTVWDVLTGTGRDVQVSYPFRPSHALVELPNDWQISVVVAPGSWSTLGQRQAAALETQLAASHDHPPVALDVLGRNGSPEGWFDRAGDAEVAICRPDGAWYHCETDPPDSDPDTPQTWRYVGVDALAALIVRVAEQPPGCLCPACAAS